MSGLPQQSSFVSPLGNEQPTRVRYLMLVLLALGVGSAYLSRNTTAANNTIANDFHITSTDLGKVLAGFSVGYFCTQVLGGWLGGRIGVRIVFPLFALLWSGCAFWTSYTTSLSALGWSRICLGLAQGVMVPCTGQALRAWFPIRTRGTASSIPAVTMQIGGTIAIFLTASMLEAPGWRVAFRLYAVTGAAWAILFALLFRNSPEQHPWTNAAEREFAHDDLPPAPVVLVDARPWWQRFWEGVSLIFTTRSVLAIGGREFFRTTVVAFVLQWLPKYLVNARVVGDAQAARLTGMVFAAFALGILPGGRLVDWIYSATGSKWMSRSLFPSIAFAGCGLCFTGSLFVEDPKATVAWIACGMFLAGAMLPAVWAGVMDIGGRRSGLVLGINNMLGTAGDAFCTMASGRLVDAISEHGWNWYWLVIPVIAYNFLGAGLSLLINPDRPVPERRA